MDLDSLNLERKNLAYAIEYYERLLGCFEKDADSCGLTGPQVNEGLSIIEAMLSALRKKQQDLEKRIASALDATEEMLDFMDSEHQKKDYSYLY